MASRAAPRRPLLPHCRPLQSTPPALQWGARRRRSNSAHLRALLRRRPRHTCAMCLLSSPLRVRVAAHSRSSINRYAQCASTRRDATHRNGSSALHCTVLYIAFSTERKSTTCILYIQYNVHCSVERSVEQCRAELRVAIVRVAHTCTFGRSLGSVWTSTSISEGMCSAARALSGHQSQSKG